VTIRYTFHVSDAGRMLRDARRAAGLTQAELARRAGLTQSVISAYESGRREPALSTLSRLVEATGAALRVQVQPPDGEARGLPSTERGQVIQRSRQRVREVAAKHGAGNLRLFGSTVRGEDRPESDIDLLVHLEQGVGLIGLARLQRELERILGGPVDLVPDDGLKPEVRAAVEREAVAL
jgi:predicted nucleotidyltransferase/DNA-binding XRE family transcriptional regulator